MVEVKPYQRMHPQLDTRAGTADPQRRPVILEGTVIGVQIQQLPGNALPEPMWLWISKPVPEDLDEVDHWWSMYLRRFDLEHTFRLFKQSLRWTAAKLQDPQGADKWTWIVVAAYTLLRLARPVAAG